MIDQQQIREHMDVTTADGQHVGTVDHVDGDRIKLTKGDSAEHDHRFVPLAAVASIDENRIILSDQSDTMDDPELAAVAMDGSGDGLPDTGRIFGTSGTGTGMGGSGLGEN